MPAPATIDEFLDLTRKSGLLDGTAIEGFCQRLREAGVFPDSPQQLAERMVQGDLLTKFQAEYLLAGKWRGFIIAGKYRLLQRVGAGGMGSVYLCEHILMKRRVALKVLPASDAEDESAIARFHREARAVAALDHPNIVRAHDIDCENKLHFLVMEYVDGSTFHDIVKRHGPMDIGRAAHYIAQAACGLQAAHEAGIVHRDIKPGNVLVDRTGTVKILDMGLARFFRDDHDELTQEHESSSVLGTADYLAPEQALDSHGVDIRADIYSLGATLYYLLAAKSPFQDGNVAQKLIWHQVRQPKPIKQLRPEVPDELAAVLAKMMAKDPEERYQTPVELMAALTAWTQEPIAPPPEQEMPQLGKAAMGETWTRGMASSHRVNLQVMMPKSIGPGMLKGDSGAGRSGSVVPLHTGSTVPGPGVRGNADTARIPPRASPPKNPSGGDVGDDADVFSQRRFERSFVVRELAAIRSRLRIWVIVAVACGLTLVGYGAIILWAVARSGGRL
jgi:eukaryotic-like serine/threonine-protein kinase